LKKVLLVVVALALMATALSGCQAPEPVTPEPPVSTGPTVGGQIVFSIGGDPNTLNPILSTDAMSGTVIMQIHNGFSKAQDTGIVPIVNINVLYKQLQELFVDRDPIFTHTKEIVDPSSLIPFYESFGSPN